MQETLGATPFSSATASSKTLFGWSFAKILLDQLAPIRWRRQKRMKPLRLLTCPKQNDHESFGTH